MRLFYRLLQFKIQVVEYEHTTIICIVGSRAMNGARSVPIVVVPAQN